MAKLTSAHLSLYLTPLQVIATRTFFVLFLRVPAKHYTVWIVLIGNWSLLFAIVLAGPATAMIQKHGPYCEHSQYESPFLADLTTTFRWNCELLVLDLCKLYIPAHRVRIADHKTWVLIYLAHSLDYMVVSFHAVVCLLILSDVLKDVHFCGLCLHTLHACVFKVARYCPRSTPFEFHRFYRAGAQ
jgi:hypothetical protein